jgi:cell division septum initiation protein DivIVA
VLALAQKLHEEHIAEGQDIRQRLITEGQSRHDQIIGETTARQEELLLTGQTKHDALVAEADVLIVKANADHERIIGEARERSKGMVVVAQEKRAEVLHGLSSERSMLQKEIEELHASERDYLARQKAYVEGQLAELEQTGADETG